MKKPMTSPPPKSVVGPGSKGKPPKGNVKHGGHKPKGEGKFR